MPVYALTESYAAAILQTAIRDKRAAELLACLFEGGSCTLMASGELLLISGSQVKQIGGGES